ncbi:MAG: hypothetical protein HON90_09710 [Halobacteriovoraceae bacterium]|nr:hypothetical protein [Halobacteriovoraceae bacterium]
METNLRNIIWIDKSESIIDEYIDMYGIKSLAKVFPFISYKEALKFISETNQKVDLIIANYCTFFWASALKGEVNLKEEPVAFDFFKAMEVRLPNTPLILFSAIADMDSRTKQFCSNKNFIFLHKDHGEKLNSQVHALIGGH